MCNIYHINKEDVGQSFMKIYCVMCFVEFDAPRKDSKCCSAECKQKFATRKGKDAYHLRLKEKLCTCCKKPFNAKDKESLCVNCKQIPREHNFELVEKELRCKHCDTIVEIVTKKNNNRNVLFERTSVCDDCRLVNKKRRSEYMKLNNPVFNFTEDQLAERAKRSKERLSDPKVLNKQVELMFNGLRKWKQSDEYQVWMIEYRRKMSKKMLEHNPMHNPDVVAKNTDTRRKNGVFLKYPKGPKHHLWKGTSPRAGLIRTRLYINWVRPIMERDGFKCTICNTKRHLEVHHLSESFKDILKKFLGETSIKDLSDDDFDKLSVDVVDYHQHVEGITVCIDCHRTIDPQRK